MKKKIMNKIMNTVLPISVTLFILVITLYAWDYIREYRLGILLGSGAVIILSILLGYFNSKKFKKGLKRIF